MNWRAVIIISILVLSFSLEVASAQSPAEHIPTICNGFQEMQNGGTFRSVNSPECPPNSAMYGVSMGGLPYRGAFWRPHRLRGYCCKLPASDILLDEHQFEGRECSDGRIATGATMMGDCPQCELRLRCTKINQGRYELGDSVPGIYFGLNSTYYLEPNAIPVRDIPAAIRYGMGRDGLTHWLTSGCIGQPFGGLAVGGQGKRCYEQFFRELRFRGIPGDPPRGTAVKMFPDCDDISDIFSPDPECIQIVKTQEIQGR